MLDSINKISIYLFVGSFLLFLLGLSQLEITQFETRFAFFAQQMSSQGFHFFPLLYGAPYPDYPASYPILIYFCSLLMGKLSLFSGVWPSAFNAAGTVVLSYRLGASRTPAWGIAAVLMMFATFYFLMTARSLSLDQFVLFATTWAFYVAYRSYALGRSGFRWGVWFACLYGFIFRGAMGFIIPLAVVVSFDLLNAYYFRIFKTLFFGLFLLMVLNAILLYLAYWEGGLVFLWQVIAMQGLSRIQQLGHYPFHFYWEYLWVNYSISAPIALLVVLSLARDIFRRAPKPDMKFLQYLLGWVLIIMLGLSIPSEKKLRYLLPIVPALSLMASWIVIDNRSWVLAQIRSALLSVAYVFPLIGLLLILAVEGFSFYQHMPLGAYYIPAALSLMFVFVVGSQALKFYTDKVVKYNIKLAIGVFSFYFLMVFMVQPMHAYLNRTQPFAIQVNYYLAKGDSPVFYQMGPDAEDVKLMLRLEQGPPPRFVQHAAELLTLPSTKVIVAKEQSYDALDDSIKAQFFVLSHGRIGHQKAIIFRHKT